VLCNAGRESFREDCEDVVPGYDLHPVRHDRHLRRTSHQSAVRK
jgi:hypothetical protein